MTLLVSGYDTVGDEDVASPEISCPWHHALIEVDLARQALLDAVEDGEILRMPPTLPANAMLRSIYVVTWVIFKRGVPPRGPVRALPSFDPERFLSLGDDDRWQVDGMFAYLRPEALDVAVGAMERLTPFVDHERRALWSEVAGVLRELQSRRLTLGCTWLED